MGSPSTPAAGGRIDGQPTDLSRKELDLLWHLATRQGEVILAGTARFLAAHTPTRRELSQVVRIATRLRRGEPLFEEP